MKTQPSRLSTPWRLASSHRQRCPKVPRMWWFVTHAPTPLGNRAFEVWIDLVFVDPATNMTHKLSKASMYNSPEQEARNRAHVKHVLVQSLMEALREGGYQGEEQWTKVAGIVASEAP